MRVRKHTLRALVAAIVCIPTAVDAQTTTASPHVALFTWSDAVLLPDATVPVLPGLVFVSVPASETCFGRVSWFQPRAWSRSGTSR